MMEMRIKRPTLHIRRLDVELLVIFLFSILPLMDSINGYLIQEKGTSIGTLYKLLIIGILFIVAIRRGKYTWKRFLLIAIPAAYVVTVVIVNILLGGSVLNMDYPVKLIFNIVTLSLLLELTNYGILNGKTYYKILNYSSVLMLLCMLIPYFMGAGYTIYSGDRGYKAFFYSQNELNACLIILFYFCLYKVILKISIASLVQLFAIFVCVLLLSTKSSMLACAAGVVLFVVEYLRRKDSKYKLLVLLLVIVAAFLAGDFVMQQITTMLQRQGDLSRTYKNDIIATITSGRIYYVQNAWELLGNNTAFFFQLLFGNGFCSSVLCEMDFIDIFFFLGAVGVVAAIGFLVYLFVKSIPNFKKDKSIVRPFAFILILGFAFLTGHVLFMATSGCYFVVFCCFNMIYFNETEKELQG